MLKLVDEARPKLDIHCVKSRAFAELISKTTWYPTLDSAAALRIFGQCSAFAQESVSFASQQKQILSDIMLTRNFQYLSGQVIRKVIDLITRTESQLVQLLIDDGDTEVADQRAEESLQGPQTPDNALAQDDVDDLLASMGF